MLSNLMTCNINYLASKLDGMTSREIEVYVAVTETGDCSGNVQDLINLTESLDCFYYIEGVTDDCDIGF